MPLSAQDCVLWPQAACGRSRAFCPSLQSLGDCGGCCLWVPELGLGGPRPMSCTPGHLPVLALGEWLGTWARPCLPCALSSSLPTGNTYPRNPLPRKTHSPEKWGTGTLCVPALRLRPRGGWSLLPQELAQEWEPLARARGAHAGFCPAQWPLSTPATDSLEKGTARPRQGSRAPLCCSRTYLASALPGRKCKAWRKREVLQAG